MELIDRVKVVSVGKSLYIPLPSNLCKIMKIEKGAELVVFKEGTLITYEKVIT